MIDFWDAKLCIEQIEIVTVQNQVSLIIMYFIIDKEDILLYRIENVYKYIYLSILNFICLFI